MGGALSFNSRSAERRDCEDSGRAEPRDEIHFIRAARIGVESALRAARDGRMQSSANCFFARFALVKKLSTSRCELTTLGPEGAQKTRESARSASCSA